MFVVSRSAHSYVFYVDGYKENMTQISSLISNQSKSSMLLPKKVQISLSKLDNSELSKSFCHHSSQPFENDITQVMHIYQRLH